jgi:hypothetical protein
MGVRPANVNVTEDGAGTERAWREDESEIPRRRSEVQEKEKEVSVIVLPYTVVDPGTMVVHFQYAGLTDGAVVRARRLDEVALLALLVLFVRGRRRPTKGMLTWRGSGRPRRSKSCHGVVEE